jgi:hypothetical protein
MVCRERNDDFDALSHFPSFHILQEAGFQNSWIKMRDGPTSFGKVHGSKNGLLGLAVFPDFPE